MSNKLAIFFCGLILIFVGLGVYSNLLEQQQNNRQKLPEKVEQSRYFQRWITNLKNKDVLIEADGFLLLEEADIYNSKWIQVFSLDDPVNLSKLNETLEKHKNLDMVVFSPSETEFLDIRNIERDGYLANQARFYGQKEDKILDARILDCSIKANCYFDRAYFLSNDVFVITEISRNIDKKDLVAPMCLPTENCTYSFKLHLIDLINNERLTYVSEPFDTVLVKLIPSL